MTAVTVTLEGPFFTKDPGRTFYQNLAVMLTNLAGEMETQTRGRITTDGDWSPFTRDAVVGYTTSAKTGKHWVTWAAVGIPGANADAVRAAAIAYERRYHPFRNTKSGVYRARALITADLTKGLE